MHYSFVPDVIAACCTLHNIVETFGDPFNECWITAIEQSEIIFEQPINREC